jgi:hypothetical protein
MFIQVIQGTTHQPEALHERLMVWERDLMPRAIGYLGSTGGCTEAGDCILIARFSNAEAARRNSERPEQSAWWAATEVLFDGPVTFHDSTDVQVMSHGDMDSAHFVQVMDGHVADRSRADAFTAETDPMLAKARPDLLGSLTAYYDADGFTEVAYFSSEDDARVAEKQEMPSDLAERFAEYQTLWRVDRYLDLTEPWLTSART